MAAVRPNWSKCFMAADFQCDCGAVGQIRDHASTGIQCSTCLREWKWPQVMALKPVSALYQSVKVLTVNFHKPIDKPTSGN